MVRAVGKVTIFRSRTSRVLLLDLDAGLTARRLAGTPGFEVTRVSSFAEATGAVEQLSPAAVVVALTQPQSTDVLALKQLVSSTGSVPVLVVSEPVTDERAVELIKAGAGGYLFCGDNDDLASRLRELMQGGVPMSEQIQRLVMQRARKSSAKMAAVRPFEAPARNLLSDRQREILELLRFGHSYEDVGVALGLSVNTVRTHVRAIYERLGAATKVEAVMIALELGILEHNRVTERPPPSE